MINVDNGMVIIDGTIIDLCVDVVTAYAEVLDAMPKDDDIQKKLSTTLIKSLFYDMARRTKEKGYDISFDEEEVASLEEDWEKAYDKN